MSTTDGDFLEEICEHCGFTYGAHHGAHHGGSNPWPRDYCPGSQYDMDWENSPGTTFKGTNTFRENDNG